MFVVEDRYAMMSIRSDGDSSSCGNGAGSVDGVQLSNASTSRMFQLPLMFLMPLMLLLPLLLSLPALQRL